MHSRQAFHNEGRADIWGFVKCTCCAGHLISSGGPLGIMGREVLSERECTRDAEWKLLHLTLLKLTQKLEVGDLLVVP